MLQRVDYLQQFLDQRNFSEALLYVYSYHFQNRNYRDYDLHSIFESFESCYETDGRELYLELMSDNEEGVFFVLNYLRYLSKKNSKNLSTNENLVNHIPSLNLILTSLAKMRDIKFSEAIIGLESFKLKFDQALEQDNLHAVLLDLVSSRYPQLMELLLRQFDCLYEFKDSNKEGILDYAIKDPSARLLTHLLHRREVFNRLCENSPIHPILAAAKIGNILAVKIMLDADIKNKDVCDFGMNNFQTYLVFHFNILNINFYSEGKKSEQELSEASLKMLNYFLTNSRVMPKNEFSLTGRGVCHYLFLNSNQDISVSRKIDSLLPILLSRNNAEIWCRRDGDGISPVYMMLEVSDLRKRMSVFSNVVSHFAPIISEWNVLASHIREHDVFEKLLISYYSAIMKPEPQVDMANLILLESIIFTFSKTVALEYSFFMKIPLNCKGIKKLEDLTYDLYCTFIVDKIIKKDFSTFVGFPPSFTDVFKLELKKVCDRLILIKKNDDERGLYQYLDDIFGDLRTHNYEILELKKALRTETNQFRSKYYKLIAILSRDLPENQFDLMKEFSEINKSMDIKELNFYKVSTWISSSESIELIIKSKTEENKLLEILVELKGFYLPDYVKNNLEMVINILDTVSDKTVYTIHESQK